MSYLVVTKKVKDALYAWGRLSFWEDAYLRTLRSHTEKLLSPRELARVADEVASKAADIFSANKDSITDVASQHHLLMTSCVLASYRTLQAYIDDPKQILGILERSFSEPGAKWIKRMTRLALLVRRDKMRVVMAYGGEKVKETYGDKFVVEQEGDGNLFFSSNVKRCGYHEFFKVNGAEELTQVFCAWDKLWADEIEPRRDGIKFERPTTLATGGDMCRFEFYRTKKR